MAQVWSLRRGCPTPPPNAVRIDRKTKWGNPFYMAGESQRDAVCDRFEKEILAHLDVEELRDKDLVCWCTYPGDPNPKRCHGHSIIAKLERTAK